MDQSKINLLNAIEEDIKLNQEEEKIYNVDELNNSIKNLIRISKKDDRKELYNLSAYDMLLICLTISYNNRSYEDVKKNLEPLKNRLNSIPHDDNNLLIMRNFIFALDEHKEEEYSRYVKKLGIDESLLKPLVKVADYSVFFKPLFLLMTFKNGYEKTQTIADKRKRKITHLQNYNLTLKDFIYFITKYSEKLIASYEYFDKRNKLNNELKTIIESGTVEILSIIPIKKDYLDYLSNSVLLNLLVYIGEILNYSYCMIGDRIDDLNSDLNASSLTKLLYAIGINPDSVDPDLADELSTIEYSTLEKRTRFLLILGLQPKEILTTYSYYLKTLDLSIINRIVFYLDSNILSKENIKNKISEISTIFSKIDANYEILKHVVDFSNMYYNESILFEDLESIKNKLSVLAEYNLTKNNFTFLLVNYEYLSVYDLMLEQEIPVYLFTNICNTSNPYLTIKRIILSKELDIPYETPTHELTKEVRFEKYAVCSNEELDFYFPNKTELPNIKGYNISNIKETELVKSLEENNRIDDTYIIGDTFVSRSKFLRNLQYLKDNNIEDKTYLISSFLCNSIINQGNLLDIREELNIQKSYLL